MSNPARLIELPEGLQAFAEEQVRAGKNVNVADVVRDALEAKKRAVLGDAIDDGLAELDAGEGVEASAEELMAEARAEAGLAP
jgi:Arc/MetJ-type ribon-helix-helix transcriptional regulator